MSMKKLIDEAVKASAAADATAAAVSQLADMADERSEEAADALDTLRRYIERAPKTAEAVLRDCVPASAILTTETRVEGHILAAMAADKRGVLSYIRRNASQQLAHAIEEKLPLDFAGTASVPPWDYPRYVYKAKVYVFTREELLAYTRDAVAAGIAQS